MNAPSTTSNAYDLNGATESVSPKNSTNELNSFEESSSLVPYVRSAISRGFYVFPSISADAESKNNSTWFARLQGFQAAIRPIGFGTLAAAFS